jgi:ribokinase
VVVTLGAAGAFVSHGADRLRGDGEAFYRCPATPVDTVDTTGAGDAFNGALAASLARPGTAPFAAHVAFACRYAGEATRAAGAASAMPHLPAGA